jgi:hypothetical protein
VTRTRTKLLEKLTNGGVQDHDFLIIKSGTRLGQDQNFSDLSIIKIEENETRPRLSSFTASVPILFNIAQILIIVLNTIVFRISQATTIIPLPILSPLQL